MEAALQLRSPTFKPEQHDARTLLSAVWKKPEPWGNHQELSGPKFPGRSGGKSLHPHPPVGKQLIKLNRDAKERAFPTRLCRLGTAEREHPKESPDKGLSCGKERCSERMSARGSGGLDTPQWGASRRDVMWPRGGELRKATRLVPERTKGRQPIWSPPLVF